MAKRAIHFKPTDGCFGDPIPFFRDGEYHLFHVAVPESTSPDCHYIGHAVSRDLLNLEELPAALRGGQPGACDENLVATGSVVERDGKFYFLYLSRRLTEWKERRETISLATSTDLITWKKHEHNPVSVPDQRLYHLGAWRDPWVIWNQQEGRYWMIITARQEIGPWQRCGCLALATSEDLIRWSVAPEPFWEPNLCARPLECPELFRWGDWWYLIVNLDGGTSYRMARGPKGPWLKPKEDCFGFYLGAGKTIFDGEHRWLLAFLKAHREQGDAGPADVRDNMAIPRRLLQNPDGTLSVESCVDLSSLCGTPEKPQFKPVLGDWRQEKDSLRCRRDGLAYAVADVPTNRCVIGARVRLEESRGFVGIAFRTQDDLRPGYVLWLAPDCHQVRYCKLPAPIWDVGLSGQPFEFRQAESIAVRIVLDGSAVEAFVGNRTSIAGRAYDVANGKLALVVQEGSATFESVTVSPLNL